MSQMKGINSRNIVVHMTNVLTQWNIIPVIPGKWAVMYMCFRGFNIAHFYDFPIRFWSCSYSV